jgi:hypothetical protein
MVLVINIKMVTFLYIIYRVAYVTEILRVYCVAESRVSKYVVLNLGLKVLNLFRFTNINIAHIFIRCCNTNNLNNAQSPDFVCRFKSFLFDTA